MYTDSIQRQKKTALLTILLLYLTVKLLLFRVCDEANRFKVKKLCYCFYISIRLSIETQQLGSTRHQQVRRGPKTKEGFFREFMGTMEVKQGCTLSPTLFGQCICQLEQFIHKAIRENGKPANRHFTVFLLICTDDALLLANSTETAKAIKYGTRNL